MALGIRLAALLALLALAFGGKRTHADGYRHAPDAYVPKDTSGGGKYVREDQLGNADEEGNPEKRFWGWSSSSWSSFSSSWGPTTPPPTTPPPRTSGNSRAPTTPPPRSTIGGFSNPTPSPPRPVAIASCQVTDILYNIKSRYILQNTNGNIHFCAKVVSPSACKSVQFTVNGNSIGTGMPSGFCVIYNPRNGGSGAQRLSAVGISQDNKAGVPVAKDLPIFLLPSWYLALFGNPGAGLFGSADNWGYRRSVEVFAPIRTGYRLNVPIVGGSFDVGANLEFAFKVTGSDGNSEMEGKGGLQINIDPINGPPSGGKIVAVASAAFGVRPVGSGVVTPTLSEVQVGYEGEVLLPTPLSYPFTVTAPIVGGRVGVSAFVNIVIESALRMVFQFQETARPLPLAFQALRGSLRVGGEITGQVSAGFTAAVMGKLIFGPAVSVSGGRLRFDGVSIEAVIEVAFQILGRKVILHPVQIQAMCTSRGCSLSKRDVITGGEAPVWAAITEKYTPTVLTTSDDQLVVLGAYPTGTLSVASTLAADVLVFSAFDPAIRTNNSLQIAFAFRTTDGQWSAPAFVPALATGAALDMPTVSAVSDSTFLAVATSSVDMGTAQLVQATFDARTGTWTPLKPLLPNTPSGAFDYMPAVCDGGRQVAFVRVTTATGDSDLMVATADAQGNYGEPVLISRSDARVFSIDAAGASALLAYVDADTNHVHLCTPSTASEWRCKESSRVASCRVTVISTGDGGFLLVSNTDNTLNVDLVDSAGVITHSDPATLQTSIMRLTATHSHRADGAVMVGWETCDGDMHCTFQYAVVDAKGKIWLVPNLTIAHPAFDDQVWAPQATAFASSGGELVYASMMITRLPSGVNRGALAVMDLPFAPRAAISSVTFSPPDFTGQRVTVSATITNHGSTAINVAGEDRVSFGLVGSSGVTTFALETPKTLMPGQSAVVTTEWAFLTAMPRGGQLSVQYTGAGVVSAPYVVDPCNYTLSDAWLETVQGEPRLYATLSASGVCATTVKVNVTTHELHKPGSITIGSADISIVPFFKKQIVVPIDHMSRVGHSVTVTVHGTNQEASVQIAVAAERHDFGLDAATFRVDDSTPGAVLVSFEAWNAGTAPAKQVPVAADLIASDGTATRIASVSIDLRAMEWGHRVVMTLPLTALVNNVNFVINDPAAPTYPETFTADNTFNEAVNVPRGSDEGSYVNPTTSGHAAAVADEEGDGFFSGRGWVPVVVVLAVVFAALIGALIFALVRVLKLRSQSESSSLGSYTPVELR